MNYFKGRICRCATIILFVVLCSGIGLQASSVSAATIPSQIQKSSCHSEYKKDIYNKQGKKVGFVYAWTDTCNNNSRSQIQACSSSTGSTWISIKFGQLSITC
jgi:hypothetical protein